MNLHRTIESGRQTHLAAHIGVADNDAVFVKVYFQDGTVVEETNGGLGIPVNMHMTPSNPLIINDK